MSEPVENERSLDELFATDPLSLTREDRKPIIEYYRSRRALFNSGGKAPRDTKTKVAKVLPNIDLGDLEL